MVEFDYFRKNEYLFEDKNNTSSKLNAQKK